MVIMELKKQIEELQRRVEKLENEKPPCNHKYERISMGLADPVKQAQCVYCGKTILWDSIFGWNDR